MCDVGSVRVVFVSMYGMCICVWCGALCVMCVSVMCVSVCDVCLCVVWGLCVVCLLHSRQILYR